MCKTAKLYKKTNTVRNLKTTAQTSLFSAEVMPVRGPLYSWIQFSNAMLSDSRGQDIQIYQILNTQHCKPVKNLTLFYPLIFLPVTDENNFICRTE